MYIHTINTHKASVMTTNSNTSNVEFRGHKFIRISGGVGMDFSNALKDVKLLTQAEFDSLQEEDKGMYRLIQKRDLQIIENNFGKENPKLAEAQGQAIIDLFDIQLRDGNVPTHAGMKSRLGLLLTLERVIGRFDADYSDAVEEIEAKQGRLVIDFLGLCLKPHGRVDMDGGEKTPLELIRTLRRVVKETR